jgi:uroporphyrinogen decarboxylase
MAAVKQKHGERLCFWGAIDIKEAMQAMQPRGSRGERAHRLLGQGGGYVLAPANHLQPDVPAANVAALFRAGANTGVTRFNWNDPFVAGWQREVDIGYPNHTFMR